MIAIGSGNYHCLGASLADTLVQGGYPAALARPTEKRRANWYRDYMTTTVQGDVQDLTRIQKLEMLPRLLSMAAGQTGRLLETFIYQELRKYADWHEQQLRFYHFRNKDKVEVDIIIEQGLKIAGVEIKAAATVTLGDFKGLKKLRDAVGEQFVAGVVFYDGESVLPFGERLFAVPVGVLVP